jgi:hypothetical protein
MGDAMARKPRVEYARAFCHVSAVDGIPQRIFTTSGTYTFNFWFRNSFQNSAGHQDIYLLAEVAQPSTGIPEPTTLQLVAAGLLALACWRWRIAIR